MATQTITLSLCFLLCFFSFLVGHRFDIDLYAPEKAFKAVSRPPCSLEMLCNIAPMRSYQGMILFSGNERTGTFCTYRLAEAQLILLSVTLI